MTAPFREALLLEAGLLHVISLSTLIATKAAADRAVGAGQGVAEFGFRRAQEPYIAARSGQIAGCAQYLVPGRRQRIRHPDQRHDPARPDPGFPSEEEAFRTVAESLPRTPCCSTPMTSASAIQTAVEGRARGSGQVRPPLAAVRLDSGDILADSIHCRQVLDEAGMNDVQIVASGDWTSSGSPSWKQPERRSMPTASEPRWQSGPDRSNTASPAVRSAASTSWSGTTPMRTRPPDSTEAPIKVAGPKSTWPGKKQVSRIGVVPGGRDPSRG